MHKIDYKKEYKALYSPSAKEITIVDVPPMRFLMVDGKGDPNTSIEFQQVMEMLFSVAYTLKFMVKGELDIDYGVMPPEGLWWMEGMNGFDANDKANWLWTLMIMQPDIVTEEMVERAVETVRKKKKLPGLEKLRFETFSEGLSAQILYTGPFSDEGPAIEKIHEFISASGHSLTGKHHEIYMSDTRRVPQEKWKTIIRQPMK